MSLENISKSLGDMSLIPDFFIFFDSKKLFEESKKNNKRIIWQYKYWCTCGEWAKYCHE